MENIKNVSENTVKTAPPNEPYAKTKAYQDFINVLSQIIEKHGALESIYTLLANFDKVYDKISDEEKKSLFLR
ncbi:hypothetical protein SAMN05446037_10178 [Anaerovirgula multivorans]|uniref:Uncharacterized protein n=1 Tax=Anaerovirgula multivorans TaxID=312168 RepID=A0A239GK43_9FIRM|nr:hypothetical protein [Anaerovirgula multivorans]SNS68424.1 hypothetical protein SAMN05446037_10178 [Anaerovirgula multivorans]